jgi:hypothetical protein
MRTRQCRLIARETCLDVQPIRLDLATGAVFAESAALWVGRPNLDVFARFDGFADWGEMVAFWAETHPGYNIYSGVHIRWLPWPEALIA